MSNGVSDGMKRKIKASTKSYQPRGFMGARILSINSLLMTPPTWKFISSEAIQPPQAHRGLGPTPS